MTKTIEALEFEAIEALGFEVKKVLILRRDTSTDRVLFNLSGPTTMPELEKESPGKNPPVLELHTRYGFAESWLYGVFTGYRRWPEVELTWTLHEGFGSNSKHESGTIERVDFKKVHYTERPLFSFCEPTTASSLRPWCIRPVKNKLFASGGIDSGPLCNRWKGNGWDVMVRITASLCDHKQEMKTGQKRRIVCGECTEEYAAALLK
jgi:hypothetical protein